MLGERERGRREWDGERVRGKREGGWGMGEAILFWNVQKTMARIVSACGA